MKALTYLLFLFVFIASSQQNSEKKHIKNGKITYQILYKSDDFSKKLNNENTISEKSKKDLMNLINDSSVLNYILLFSDNESFFSKEEKIDQKKSMKEILSGKGLYYSDINEKYILNEKVSFGEKFIINVAFKEWHLSQEYKTIGEYRCFKATTNKKVETRRGIINKEIIAWYAPSIPISFGPKDFSGLPGLIIELVDENVIFKVAKIEFNLKNKIKIKKPISGKFVTEDEYNKVVKKMFFDYRNKRKN